MIETVHRAFRYIANRELVITAAIAPLLIFPTLNRVLTAFALIGIVALWIVRWISRGSITRRTRLDIYILIFMLTIPIAMWVSPLPEQSALAAPRVLLGFAFYYALVNSIDNNRDFRRILNIAVASGVVVALVGLVASDWNQDKIPLLDPIYEFLPDWSHLFGSLASEDDSTPGAFHPNFIGATLAMLLPIAISLFVSARQRREKIAISISILTMAFVLILTQSRLGMASFVVASSIAFLRSFPHFRKAVLVLGIAVSLLVILVGLSTVVDALTRTVVGTGFDTWHARTVLWDSAFQALYDFPFTGMGLSTFYPTVTNLYALDLSPNWMFGHTHETYLQIGVDFGLAGLLSFLGIMLTAHVLSQPSRREKHVSSIRTLRVGVWASLLTYTLFGLFDGLPLWTKPGFLIWVILALTIVGHRLANPSSGVENAK